MKNKKIWGAAFIIVFLAIFVGVIVAGSNSESEFQKQLDLGQKYLDEMKYEEAVVAFEQAIMLEEKSVKAYIGLADAYIGLNVYETAISVLEDGYEITNDEELKKKLEELRTEWDEIKENEEAEKQQQRVQEVLGELYILMEGGDDKAIVEYIWNHNWNDGYSSYSLSGDTKNGIVLDAYYDSFYFGEKMDGNYEGTGVWYDFIEKDEETGEISYEKYEGEWKDGRPNGTGSIISVHSGHIGYNGNEGYAMSRSIYRGMFLDGYLNGDVEWFSYSDIYESLPWYDSSSDYDERRCVADMGKSIPGSVYWRVHWNDGKLSDWTEVDSNFNFGEIGPMSRFVIN